MGEAGQSLLHHYHQLLEVVGGEDEGPRLLQQTHSNLDQSSSCALEEDQVQDPGDEAEREIGGEDC